MDSSQQSPAPLCVEHAGITLDPPKTVCVVHSQLFKPAWPRGWMNFAAIGLERLLASQKFQDATGGKISRVDPLLEERPLCCRLFDARELLPVITRVREVLPDLWKRGLCNNCSNFSFGVEVDLPTFDQQGNPGPPLWYPHLCFICLTKRIHVRN